MIVAEVQKHFQLSLKLSIGNVLSQRQWQSISHTCSSDAEASVAKAGIHPEGCKAKLAGYIGR